jgi:glutathione peroxidase
MLRHWVIYGGLGLGAILAGLIAAKIYAAGRNVVQAPSTAPTTGPATTQMAPSVLDFTVRDLEGKPSELKQHKGQVVLIVNVASKCGLTPQYKQLEALYLKYKDRGLVIIGFPANDFLGQEPGTPAEIRQFCTLNYDVTFPLMEKITVKGKEMHPVYKFLTEKATAGAMAGDIEWNFAKFLVDRQGQLMARFGSRTKPDDAVVVTALETALGPPVKPTAVK